ncbi:hypothetical protein B0H14DRAFT_2627406 [Mycena olivaceomarginata]|nr:hypothetical protein B0H14DRAFT_2627406 [Mycena olivaceomarginata]
MVSVMDATTILGRRVNEGECMPSMRKPWSLGKHPACGRVKKKTQAQLQAPKRCGVQNPRNELCKHSARHPTCPLGRPVDKGWMGAAQGLKKGPSVWYKIAKTGCASAAPGFPHALWAGQWIGSGWSSPGPVKRPPWGCKKPQNRLHKRSIGRIHGGHVTPPWIHPCKARWLQPTDMVATKHLVSNHRSDPNRANIPKLEWAPVRPDLI